MIKNQPTEVSVMDLHLSCCTVLGRWVRRLHIRHHAQMRMVIAAALDDLPDYRVEINHGDGPVIIVEHSDR